jgi:Serine hydroxymethyltransferase
MAKDTTKARASPALCERKAMKRSLAAESMPAFGADHTIKAVDPELWAAIEGENRRQHDHIELIASENYVSPALCRRRARN